MNPLLVFFLMMLTCCFQGEGVKEAYAEASIFADKIEQRYPGSESCEIWVAHLKGQIQYISLMVGIPLDPVVSEAREIFVGSCREFINQLNRNSKLRSFAEGGVFGFEHLRLTFYFYDPRGGVVKNIALVTGIPEKIYYDSQVSEEMSFLGMHKETWQEAIEIMDNSPSEDHFQQPSTESG